MFRLVLAGRAPELVPFYPCLGGTADPAEAWPVLRQVLTEHADELRPALEVPPQTNEVGRSVALLAGLFEVAAATGRTRLRLLELGASAGLNLLVDRYAYSGTGGSAGAGRSALGTAWRFGDPTSPVAFADPYVGEVRPCEVTIVDRRGCDLHPVDTTRAEGRRLLTSFVWPFQVDRHERLAAALRVAAGHPVRVDRAAASDWLPSQLEPPGDDVLPVVWHSITRLYWPPEEVAAVEAALAAYGRDHPLARVAMEFGTGDDAPDRPELRTTVWSPGRPPQQRRLGTAHDHGPPVRLDPRG